MGKHITTQQEEEMVSFMEKHPQLAKGMPQGDRVDIEKLWENFAEILNSVGGPSKNVNGWKKIWSDKKSTIKKKLSTNKRESRATGGRPYNQLYVSSREKAIGKLCGLYEVVDGISKSSAFGYNVQTSSEGISEDVVDSETEREPDEPTPSSSNTTRKRKNESSLQNNLKNFMSSETNVNLDMSKTLIEMLSVLKLNVEISKNSESDMRRVYRSLDKLAGLVGEQIEAINKQTEEISKQRHENERHHKEIEKLLYEKNLLKKQTLEIQKEQLEVYKM